MGQIVATLVGHQIDILAIEFDPNGQELVSASLDATVKRWDARSGREISSFEYDKGVADVAFSPDGSRIASASNDSTIRVWDSHSGKELMQMIGHSAGVKGIAFSPDGKRIASTSFDSALKLWDTQTGLETMTIEESVHGKRSPDGSEAHGIQCAAFSPDGLRIAAGTDNGIIKFLNAPLEHESKSLSGHTNTVVQYGLSDAGNQIYSESANEKFVWDLATGRQIENAEWNPPVERRPVSPDGRWFVTS